MYMMIAHYDNYQYYMLMQEYTAMIARYTSRLYISFSQQCSNPIHIFRQKNYRVTDM